MIKDNCYIIVGTDPIEKRDAVLKNYKNLKAALWDADFFALMYTDIRIYKKIIENGEQCK